MCVDCTIYTLHRIYRIINCILKMNIDVLKNIGPADAPKAVALRRRSPTKYGRDAIARKGLLRPFGRDYRCYGGILSG